MLGWGILINFIQRRIDESEVKFVMGYEVVIIGDFYGFFMVCVLILFCICIEIKLLSDFFFLFYFVIVIECFWWMLVF